MINIITMTSVMMMIIIIQKGEFFTEEYARVRHFADTVMFPVNKAQKRGDTTTRHHLLNKEAACLTTHRIAGKD